MCRYLPLKKNICCNLPFDVTKSCLSRADDNRLPVLGMGLGEILRHIYLAGYNYNYSIIYTCFKLTLYSFVWCIVCLDHSETSVVVMHYNVNMYVASRMCSRNTGEMASK